MIRHTLATLLFAGFAVLCQGLAPASLKPVGRVNASVPGVTCSARMTSISFGNVMSQTGGLLGGSTQNIKLHTTGYFTYQCTNSTASARTVKACISIGNPGGNRQRQMHKGNDDLDYALYKDAAHTNEWGSGYSTTWGSPYAETAQVPANGRSTPRTIPIYAEIDTGQAGGLFGGSLPEGDYTAMFADADTAFDVVDAAKGSCVSAGGEDTARFPFQVTAHAEQSCQVTTSPLDFGATSTPSNQTATTTLTVACTDNHTGYEVGLDAGKHAAGGQRRMRGGPTDDDYIPYSLYQDSAHATEWGNDKGTDTVTGNSSTHTFTVYGEVGSGLGMPPPGEYRDAVTVYVYY